MASKAKMRHSTEPRQPGADGDGGVHSRLFVVEDEIQTVAAT
jgi:hypothetical protein